MSKLAERLKELRNVKGLRQSDLAELLNVPRSTLATWETGKFNPDLKTIEKLSEILGVSTDYLLGKIDKEEENKEPLSIRLKKLRALLGITQEQFAKRSEIPLEIITAIENDQEVDPVVFMKLDILGTLLTFEKLKDRIVPFSEMKKIPILGKICAGNGEPAYEEILGYAYDPKGNSDFSLLVKGDSMSPKFNDGDLVYVKKQTHARSGQYVVAYANGDECILRRYIHSNISNVVILEPENPEYEKVILVLRDNPKWGIIGVVTGKYSKENY